MTWRQGGYAQDTAVLVVTPVRAAAVGATLFLARVHLAAIAPYNAVVRVTEERWWACALTGWAVLDCLAGGVRGLARACLSAWLAAVLTGLALIAHGAPAVYGTFEPLSSAIMTSSVLLFYLAVPTACLALLPDHQPAVARHPWPAPVGASAAAAMAVTLVLTAGLDDAFAPLPPANPTPPPPPRPGRRHADTGAARSRARGRSGGPYLGAAWIPGSFPKAAPAVVIQEDCPPCSEDYECVPRPLARAEAQFKAAPALPAMGLRP